MIFVDTSAWIASVLAYESRHAKAKAWLASNSEPLVTTDYVVDETLTTLRARGEPECALAMGESFFAGGLARIHVISADDLEETWRLFRRYRDKQWSFTDCASFVIMAKFGVQEAFAFDHHFRQFGFVSVLPV